MSAPSHAFLVAALRDVAALDRNGTRCYCDAFASGSTRHTERCAEIAKAVTEPTDHAPYRPPMNWEERARRAEALLAEMDSAMALLLASSPSYGYTEEERAAHRWRAELAHVAWVGHRADLDTLEVGGR